MDGGCAWTAGAVLADQEENRARYPKSSLAARFLGETLALSKKR